LWRPDKLKRSSQRLHKVATGWRFFFVAIVAALVHTCTGGPTVTDQLFRQRCSMCSSIAWNKRTKFSKCHEVGWRGRWRSGVKKIFIHILYNVHSRGLNVYLYTYVFYISIYMVCKMYLKMRSFSYLVITIRRIGARVRVAFRQSCSSSGNSSAGLVSAMAATDDVFFSRCGFRCRSFLRRDCIARPRGFSLERFWVTSGSGGGSVINHTYYVYRFRIYIYCIMFKIFIYMYLLYIYI